MTRNFSFLPLLLLIGAALFPATAAHAADRVKIDVDGLSRDLRKNVLATLSLEEARGDKDLTEDRIRRLHARAPDEIQLALQPFGYYRPSVQSTLERQGDTWVAHYTVDPGPPLKVTHLDLQVVGAGADDPGFRQRERDFPLHQGDTVVHSDYEGGKTAFEEYAAENGYLDAGFQTNEIRVDLASYTADVVLHFETGPRYLFGPVFFHQDFLDPNLLVGYITFKPGEPLNANKLLEVQNALSDSPYFQRVEVLTREKEAQGLEVPIDVNLVASPRQRWTAGGGYGTDTGPRGTLGLELRRINRAGHRGQSEVRLSQIEKSFSANYQIPGAYPRTDVITFQTAYADLHPDTSRSKSALIGAGLTQARGSWREAFGLNYRLEDFTVGLDKGTSNLLVPQASWTRVQADDRIYTTNGNRVELDLLGASKSALSDATFLQGKIDGKLIHSFGGPFRLITRAQLGYTQTDQFHDLPPTLRFFAGGDQSVRGFAYQALGPLDEAGNVIGGKALLTGSVEVDYTFLEEWKFLKKWGVAAFYDTGNAFESLSGPLERGAGVGLRWLSPIGPIRADVAWALSEPGTPIRFHLTVGPDL